MLHNTRRFMGCDLRAPCVLPTHRVGGHAQELPVIIAKELCCGHGANALKNVDMSKEGGDSDDITSCPKSFFSLVSSPRTSDVVGRYRRDDQAVSRVSFVSQQHQFASGVGVFERDSGSQLSSAGTS